MMVYKIEVMVIDFDEVGEEGIKDCIENTKYPNWCISPRVKRFQGVDIGEWDDDHPLNKRSTEDEEYKRLFDEEVYKIHRR